ncbi:MAG: cysteine rich repeat-containing protein [Myxococcales bacterium]
MRSTVAGVLILLTASAMWAAEHPCKEDAARLCQGVEPGEGRILQCLKQHEADLSPACKQKRDSFRERMQEIRAACEEDARKFCAGVQPGGGRIASCLQQHESDLSEACRNEGRKIGEERRERRGLMQDLQQSCQKDAQKLCSDVKPGGGRIARCLRSHKNELSQECIAAIEQAKER